jgi:hypothetical protein
MTLPFTIEQFVDVFRRYNESVWPLQWILNALAIVAFAPAVARGRRPSPSAGRVASGILASLWVWMGVAYHFGFFRAINPAASLFALAFVAEGALIAWLGVVHSRIELELRSDAASRIGVTLVAYALIAYPLIGYVLGHRYPAAPTFGVPCPTTIFTFGMLLLCRPRCPRVLLVIPSAWALLGVVAAIQLGMWEDIGLVVAAIAAAVVALSQHASPRLSPKERYA